jgi:hypothetical protein
VPLPVYTTTTGIAWYQESDNDIAFTDGQSQWHLDSYGQVEKWPVAPYWLCTQPPVVAALSLGC